MPETDPRDRYERYLLGEMSEEEREALSRLFFENDEAFDRLCEAEGDLIDAFARGHLTTRKAELVGRLIMESSQSDRIATARALAGAARRGPRVPAAYIGLAAAIVVGLISWGLILRGVQSSRPAAPPPRVETAAPRVPAVFSFYVTAGTVRGRAETQRIRVSPGAAAVAIQIDLEAGYSNYEVTLRAAAGREVARASAVNAGRFALNLPAAELPPGNYEIAVTGQRRAEKPEAVNYYYFTVE